MSSEFNRLAWATGANMYEVNVRQYTHEGTFDAFAAHLPRLRDMGIDILWFMPVTPISIAKRLGKRGSYYACSSYTDINPEFGDLEDFRSLVKTAQDMGFRVMIDWVANHTGWDHPWMREHPDWYAKDIHGNFTEKHGWDDVIDLDYDSADLRKAMIACMQFWIREVGIDGFRCDMAHLVPLDFWREARIACDAVKPLLWLAECEVVAYHDVFDISYSWEWMHVSERFMKGEAAMADLKATLNKYAAYPPDALKLFFTSNHDENSWNGTEYEKYGPAARTFAVFSGTWPGMHLLYSGQELPNLKRLPFFEKAQIDWTDSKPLLHEFYQALFRARHLNPAFQAGASCEVLDTPVNDRVFSFFLANGAGKALVLLNLSASERIRVPVMLLAAAGNYYNVFSGTPMDITIGTQIELQPREARAYSSVK